MQIWHFVRVVTGREEVLDWVPCREADIGWLYSRCSDFFTRRELPVAFLFFPEVHQVAVVTIVLVDRRREPEPTLRDNEGGLTPTIEVDQFLL